MHIPDLERLTFRAGKQGPDRCIKNPIPIAYREISMGHQSRSKITGHVVAGAVAALALGAMPAYADIELGKGFSVSGFADMSAWSLNPKGGGSSIDSAGIDQFETDFMWSGSNGVSARVDI